MENTSLAPRLSLFCNIACFFDLFYLFYYEHILASFHLNKNDLMSGKNDLWWNEAEKKIFSLCFGVMADFFEVKKKLNYSNAYSHLFGIILRSQQKCSYFFKWFSSEAPKCFSHSCCSNYVLQQLFGEGQVTLIHSNLWSSFIWYLGSHTSFQFQIQNSLQFVSFCMEGTQNKISLTKLIWKLIFDVSMIRNMLDFHDS